ncbi:hypothetical protein VpasPP24_52 [Vibrio phage Vpas_PP24]|nr:hypothetical protein VpasPP24_52 [Vibrio phage Vpas_PP24]
MFKFNPIKQAIFEGFFQRIVSLPDPTPEGFIPNPDFVLGAHDDHFYPDTVNTSSANIIFVRDIGIEFSQINLTNPDGTLFSNFTAVPVARPDDGSAHFYAYPSDNPSPQTKVNGSITNNPRRRHWNYYTATRGGSTGSNEAPWTRTLVVSAVVNDDMSLVRAPRPDLDLGTTLNLSVPLDSPALEHTFLASNDDDPYVYWSFTVDKDQLDGNTLISSFSEALTFPVCDFTGLRQWAIYLRDTTTGELKDISDRGRPNSFYFDPILVYDVSNPSIKYAALSLSGFRQSSYVGIPAEYAKHPDKIKDLELLFCFYGHSKFNNVIDYSNESLAVSHGQTMSFVYGRDEDNNIHFSESGFVPNTSHDVGEDWDVNYRAMANSVSAISTRMSNDLETIRSEVSAEENAIHDLGKTYKSVDAYLGKSLQALNNIRGRRVNGTFGWNSPAVLSTPTHNHGGAVSPWFLRRRGYIEGGDPYAATRELYLYYEPHRFSSALVDGEFTYRSDYGTVYIRPHASYIDFDLYGSTDGDKYYIKRIKMVRVGTEFVQDGSRGTKCPYEMYATIINNAGEVMVDNELIWRGNLLYAGQLIQTLNAREDITADGIITKNFAGLDQGWIDLFDSPFVFDNPSIPDQSYVLVAYGTIVQIEPPVIKP